MNGHWRLSKLMINIPFVSLWRGPCLPKLTWIPFTFGDVNTHCNLQKEILLVMWPMSSITSHVAIGSSCSIPCWVPSIAVGGTSPFTKETSCELWQMLWAWNIVATFSWLGPGASLWVTEHWSSGQKLGPNRTRWKLTSSARSSCDLATDCCCQSVVINRFRVSLDAQLISGSSPS